MANVALSNASNLDAVQYQEQASAPSTPSSGYLRTYAKTDGEFYAIDDAGSEKCLSELGTTDHDNILFQEKGSAPSTPASTKWRLYFKSDGLYIIDDAGSETLVQASSVSVDNGICEGRLTAQSGEPSPTGESTTVTTVYFTPYKGNNIALYNGSSWDLNAFTEVSLSLSGLTANTNYDVFIYDSTGITGELVAWTNDTTRATAVVYQDGVLVKDGATARRYVGTIRTTSTTGQTEDSYKSRLIWNYYNQKKRIVRATTTTDSWAYATAGTWRVWNNSTATWQLNFVVGLDEVPLSVEMNPFPSSQAVATSFAFGVDSTSAPSSARYIHAGASLLLNLTLNSQLQLGTGYHYVVPLEYLPSAVSKTYFGDGGVPAYIQAGIEGHWYC